MKQIRYLVDMHFKEFWREPGIIFWAILFPVLMALGLGSAFTEKREMIKTIAFVQEDKRPSDKWMEFTAQSETIKDSIVSKKLGSEKLGFTEYRFRAVTWDEAIRMLKKGKTNVIIKQTHDSLEYHFDPLNPEAQVTYLQLSSAVNGEELSDTSSIKPTEQAGTRYIDFLIPGLVAWGIMMSCMWGISYNNIDKRIRKLLRRMVATPMKKSNYMIAQFISRLSLGAMEASILIIFSWWIFDVQIQGSLLALILMFIAGHIAFNGIAILVSSRTDNSQIANGLINLVVMPMMILSGIFFSYHNFPDWMVNIIELLPLTMLADNIRNVFIEGATVFEVLPKAVALTIIGLAFMIPGLRVYKWY